MSNWKPMNHPDYEIAPGMYNLSQWSLENEPKGDPKFKPGDCVRLTIDLYVVAIGKDCDGSHLYALSFDEYAHAESNPRDYACLHAIGQESLALVAPLPPSDGADEMEKMESRKHLVEPDKMVRDGVPWRAAARPGARRRLPHGGSWRRGCSWRGGA